ncbi:uncharacterized protein LOC127838275 isoform X1 [Dreissena polymorpha]|uniref:uncharacterized protein LOC127838275 isoform X1 n=1 Tax=Dreissena polymorpha TaxID=45954 RepID=UPI0022654D19|nr:uncharacterized protein LOC127838275 isoform X1 [Dreissena polymorpha]
MSGHADYIRSIIALRRELMQQITGSTQFPLKFANHRWLENVPVTERAISLWDNMQQYIQETEKSKAPTCKSYEVIRTAVKDPLIIAKLHVFKSVAKLLDPFLSDFQTEAPMAIFLGTSLAETIISILRRFIKPDIMETITSSNLGNEIDPSDKTLHVIYSKVEIGFQAEKALKDAQPKTSEKQRMEFRMSAKDFLEKTSQKILEKSPVKYSLVRNLSSLDPRMMAGKPEKCRKQFKRLVHHLNSLHKVNDDDCDKVYEEYNKLIDRIPLIGVKTFSEFDLKKDRLDAFYAKILTNDFGHLKNVVCLILVLCHGQSDVERGFSVNKELVVENLAKETLIGQRIICDYVKTVGGVLNVPITKDLLKSVQSSNAKYNAHLSVEKEKKLSEEKKLKRKLETEELNKLKDKKAKLENDVVMLEEKTEKLMEKAEATRHFAFVTESNILRIGCKDKRRQLEELEKEIKPVKNKMLE